RGGGLAGEDKRASVARRRVARRGEGGVGGRGLMRGVGFERDLAPVMRDARRERAGAALLELPADLDRGSPVAFAFVQVEQRPARFGVEGGSGGRLVGIFGPIEQAGLHEI